MKKQNRFSYFEEMWITLAYIPKDKILVIVNVNICIYAIICTYIFKESVMIELGISQAQSQFTKLLSQSVLVVDKKSHNKKAVILPYEEYEQLVKRASASKSQEEGIFDRFVGILDDDFKTDDAKYNRIVS